MGKFITPNEKRIKGPWLLGLKELEELAKIFDEVYSSSKLTFNPKKGRGGKHCESTFERTAMIFSEDGAKLVDESLLNLLKDSRLKSIKPVLLQLKINKLESYSHFFYLKISRNYLGELEYEVNCEDISFKEDLIFKLDKWIEKNKPKKIEQFWSEWGQAFFIPALLVFLFMVVLLITNKKIVLNEEAYYRSLYKNEINEILKTGVDKTNEEKAIEILLKISVNYEPKQKKSLKRSLRFYLIMIVSALMLLFSYRPSRTTFGIGQCKREYKFYVCISKLFFYSIPIFIILPLVINWISNFLK